MLEVPHVVLGAALGEAVVGLPGAPAIAFGMGLISHYFLDSLPHWERLFGPKFSPEEESEQSFSTETPVKQWPKFFVISAAIDLILALALIYYFNWRLPNGGHFYLNPVFWGCFGAILPDLLDNIPFWNRKISNWPIIKQQRYLHRYFHISGQSQNHMPKYLGLITQLVVFFLAAWFVLAH